MKMNELQRTTLTAAFTLFGALILLFICIFRVSNATALVIIVNTAILGFVSLVTSSRLRYLVLAALAGVLALELFLYEPSSTLANVSILVRFSITGLLVTYFASLLTTRSHVLYLDMRRLARQRQDALAESRRWLTRVNALVMVITTISTKNRLQDIFTEGLEEARKVFNADSGLIYSVSEKDGHMAIVGSFGYSDEVLDKMKRRGMETATLCQACTDVAPVPVDNLATDEKCAQLQKVTTGSCVCLPIVEGDTLLGVLHIRRRHPDAFTPEDIQLAQSMTYQFGLAMQRASLFEQVNRLAITDHVTGLYNYRKQARPGARDRPFEEIPPPVLLHHGRHRPLQELQRHLRPPGGRRDAARGGARAQLRPPRGRPRIPLRGRGVLHTPARDGLARGLRGGGEAA